ncbi:hypothetical protein HFN89_05660 [Rhizobium laguerreae]|nr:hypothetical protein [Rhizobium laguerreae]
MTTLGFITEAEDLLFDIDRLDAEEKAAGIIAPHTMDTIRSMHFGFKRNAASIARALDLNSAKVQEVIERSTPEEAKLWAK